MRNIFRLGLRQFAAGMLSVVVLGMLNRVMKVELGVELGLVSLVLSAHYFAAPLAIPLGHRSDIGPIAATTAPLTSPPARRRRRWLRFWPLSWPCSSPTGPAIPWR